MNRDTTTAQAVKTWLQDGATRLPDRVLDRVLDEVATTPQRRSAWAVRPFVKVAVAAVAVVAAAIVASVALPMARNLADAPPAGSVSSRISSPLGQSALDAGTHTIEGVLGVDVTFTVPDGWSVGDVGSDHLEITKVAPGDTAGGPDAIGLGFFLIDNLFSDPCAPDDRMIDPPIGPTVEDLAAGFANVPGYGASAPVATAIDGYDGLRIDLAPTYFMCRISDAHLWTTPAAWIQDARGELERNRLWILDVEGTRLVVDAYALSGAVDEDPDLESIVESIRIDP